MPEELIIRLKCPTSDEFVYTLKKVIEQLGELVKVEIVVERPPTPSEKPAETGTPQQPWTGTTPQPYTGTAKPEEKPKE